MKNVLCNILALLLVYSCSGNGSIKGRAKTDLDDFKTFAIDVESKSISISDLVESVEILRLEETPKSLLSNFYNIERLGKNFVFNNPTEGVVFVFDELGNFKNRFSNQGSGPKEYSLMLNTWVEGDSIAVFDPSRMRIQKYDVKGNHLATGRLPYSSAEMAFWDGKYYLDISTRMLNKDEKFGVLIINRNMEEFVKAIPLKATKPFGVFWRSPFISYEDELTYHDTIRDTIYVTDNNTFKPLLSVDFGQKWAWRDPAVLLDRSKANTILRRRGLVNKFQALVGPEHLFVQNYWSGKIQNYLIDRLTGVVQRIGMGEKSKSDISFVPFRWDDNRLLASLQSTDVSDFIKSVGNTKIKLREGSTLEEIESSENPVLVWVKFK